MEEEGVWRTIRGRRIFIKKGQSLDNAIKENENRKSENRYVVKKEKARQIIDDFKAKKQSNNIFRDTQTDHTEKIKQLNDIKYPDGTYDLKTMKRQNLESGYQVSFYQSNVKLTSKQYQKAHEEFLKYSSDGKAYAGKFGGEPEVSYNIKSQKDAYMLMKKYNQHSMCKYREGGKIRFYYNYTLDEEKNKTNFGKGGHK